MQIATCVLAAYFVAQLLKYIAPAPLKPWMKMVGALAASEGVAAYWYWGHTGKLIVVGLAGAGGAVGYHRLLRLLTLLGDGAIYSVANRLRGRNG